MGRNKDLRKKIAGHEQVVQAHERKIRDEQRKIHPDEALIAGWSEEIAAHKGAVERLNRRLKREW